MTDRIFLFRDDNQPVPMGSSPFEAEVVLQELLARAPDLLAGITEGAATPRRWALVSREQGVPDADDAADRWSLDHLFLDQDGIPTLVEVKRASDERGRRK